MVAKTIGLEAFDLTTSMADVVDLDLFELMKDQSLKFSEMKEIIENCKCCSSREGCGAWLMQNAAGKEIADFCPNRGIYEKLKSVNCADEGSAIGAAI